MSKMNLQVVLNQIDVALVRYNDLWARSKYDDCSDQPDIELNEVLTILAAMIDRIAPRGSRYRENAHEALTKFGASNPHNFKILPGILVALRSDYVAGYL